MLPLQISAVTSSGILLNLGMDLLFSNPVDKTYLQMNIIVAFREIILSPADKRRRSTKG